jgi:hypothetical protein
MHFVMILMKEFQRCSGKKAPHLKKPTGRVSAEKAQRLRIQRNF